MQSLRPAMALSRTTRTRARRVAGSIAVTSAALMLGASVTPAAAAPAPAAVTATPAAAGAQQICATTIRDDGRAVAAACEPGAGGTQFRVVVTICGTSSCQQARGPWWPRDSVWRVWSNSGTAVSVDTIEFR
ncbi:hypothetical protein FB561_6684 [Kribbella amoyensis]|uniref:Alpha amylase inhibitor n=1 Tax=Kribbella amoyensis TaxID=996641 RepID=A0A561B8F5_9ACTN|nr:hypothetical protein FB561_6684 [Kribbella amoyensis]